MADSRDRTRDLDALSDGPPDLGPRAAALIAQALTEVKSREQIAAAFRTDWHTRLRCLVRWV